MKPKGSKEASKPEGFECSFCHKLLKHEAGLIRHMCRLKRRYLERTRPDARLGFMAYSIFYGIHHQKKSVDQFIRSNVYQAFVNFGKYIIDVNAILPEEFIRYSINSKLKLDKWCSDKHYTEYVNHVNRLESCDRALERTLLLAVDWAVREHDSFHNFFRNIARPLAIMWIMSGKISPWALFNCDSGEKLVRSFSNEQYALMAKAIDIKFWQKKFADNMKDVRNIQEELQKAGI